MKHETNWGVKRRSRQTLALIAAAGVELALELSACGGGGLSG
jgi:hypothetical protein